MSFPTPNVTADLLVELDALGIQLRAQGDRLQFRPRDRVPAALIERMRECKAELLALARRREELAERISQQLDCLVPCRAQDGRQTLVHPYYREELEQLGL